MKLRGLDGLNPNVVPQPASGARPPAEPDAPLPADSADLSRPGPKAKSPSPQAKEEKKSPESPPVPLPTPAPSVPVTLVEFGDPSADLNTAVLAPTTPAPAPAPAPAAPPPTSTRIAELPKGPAVLGVLSRAIHASRRLAVGFLTFAGGDPLGRIKKEQEAVNEYEPKLDAEIEAKIAELQKAGQTGDLKTEAARQVLQAKTADFRARLADGAKLEDLKVEAFAVARKATQVVLGMRQYDVQVMGGLAMTEGKVSEMKTGEGKTITAVMPLYLYGLTGKGAHLVTVNDYLVKRDFNQLKPVYEFLGLSAGVVHEELNTADKKAAYACDITYVTNHSVGFDFLRDSMAREPEQRVQRAPNFALVDEVDEILIDEARTPMILSKLAAAAGDEHRTFDIIVKSLEPGRDFKANQKDHYAYLTDEGLEFVEVMLAAQKANQKQSEAYLKSSSLPEGTPLADVTAAMGEHDRARKETEAVNKLINRHLGLRQAKTDEEKQAAQKLLDEARADTSVPSYSLYDKDNLKRLFFLNNALDANALFNKDEDYLAHDDKVDIVDQFKGRTMEGRRFTNGLHQALEAKEGVTIQPYQRTLAQITYPDLFRRYPHLAGMSGTAMSAAGEFGEAYNLEVVAIPPNKPKALKTDNDVVFRTMKEKFEFVADKITELYKEGKPVLVGTRSIPANKYLSFLLAQRGIHHQVLNAQSVHENTDEEAAILADAGRSGMVTLATNMAGRGVDIKPDLMNYKLMSVTADAAARSGQAVVLDVDKPKDAEQIGAWLESGGIKFTVIPEGQPAPAPVKGEALIRVAPKETDTVDPQVKHVNGRALEYRTPGDTKVGKVMIDADQVNYKKLADQAVEALGQGKMGVFLDVSSPAEATRVAQELGRRGHPVELSDSEIDATPAQGHIMVRIDPKDPPTLAASGWVAHLDGRQPDYQTGGLHLIMTERHEAERIDLQLEGRPARQGQPGYRQAVLSLEDELIQFFGTDKLKEFFDAMGVPEGKGISDPRVDEWIRKAQRAVEDKYFEVRKETTKYGQVGNKQREVFTQFRDEIVDRKADVGEMARDWIPGAMAYEAFFLEAERQRTEKAETDLEYIGIPRVLKADQVQRSLDEISETWGVPVTLDLGKKKKVTLEELTEMLGPQLLERYDEAARQLPAEGIARYQRKVILDVADEAWMDHLENMDALRHGVGMEAMAQKDPWIEFQLRGFDLFKEMMDTVHHESGSRILKRMVQEAGMVTAREGVEVFKDEAVS